MTDQARAPSTQRKVLEAMRAVLSDDHSYERGLAALHDLIDQVLRDEGATGLGDLTVALSLELAKALEEIRPGAGPGSRGPGRGLVRRLIPGRPILGRRRAVTPPG